MLYNDNGNLIDFAFLGDYFFYVASSLVIVVAVVSLMLLLLLLFQVEHIYDV